MKTGFVKSHFLDSGAFSLSRKISKHQEKFYDSKEFWEYMDSYAAFIKKYKIAIDLYANEEKKIIRKWFNYINNSKFFNRRLTFETNAEYKAANYFYYMELLKHIPEWPWPFRIKKRTLL